jgi:hypothetical protein
LARSFRACPANLVRGVLTSPKWHQQRRVDLSGQLSTALREWRRYQRVRLVEEREGPRALGVRSREGTAFESGTSGTCSRACSRKRSCVRSASTVFDIPTRRYCCNRASRSSTVKEQLGHASIQITVDTYGHLIPGVNRAAVDRLDDAPMQPRQPEPFDEDPALQEMQELLGKSGEPRRNRTFNPQIESSTGQCPLDAALWFCFGKSRIWRPPNPPESAPCCGLGCS